MGFHYQALKATAQNSSWKKEKQSKTYEHSRWTGTSALESLKNFNFNLILRALFSKFLCIQIMTVTMVTHITSNIFFQVFFPRLQNFVTSYNHKLLMYIYVFKTTPKIDLLIQHL